MDIAAEHSTGGCAALAGRGTMDTSMTAVILDGLNQAQHEAVVHEDGPLLILAGAGTGKTRTITRRVAHLVSNLRVPAGRILAITFTNKRRARDAGAHF